jgi:hypothetical protein
MNTMVVGEFEKFLAERARLLAARASAFLQGLSK